MIDCRLLSFRRALVMGRIQKYRRYRTQSVSVANAQHHAAFLHSTPQLGGQASRIIVSVDGPTILSMLLLLTLMQLLL